MDLAGEAGFHGPNLASAISFTSQESAFTNRLLADQAVINHKGHEHAGPSLFLKLDPNWTGMNKNPDGTGMVLEARRKTSESA